MSVDTSLAKGLRSFVMKRIMASRNDTDKAAALVFRRKASMPTTRKGVRRMYADLSKHMNRFALASNDLNTLNQDAFWLRWSLRQGVAIENWEEDQLSVDGLVFDLLSPDRAFIKYDFPVGLSMHLVERTFSRLNTTDNEVVLTELIAPTLIACGLSNILFIELLDRGIESMPLMIPTANGALVGDVVVNAAGGDFQLRTFLGGEADLSPAKARLRDALREWDKDFQQVLGDALQFGSMGGFEAIKCNLDNNYVINVRDHVKRYVDILDNYHNVLDARDVRTERENEERKKWSR